MKILTKKKQEKILELLIEGGTVVCDKETPVGVFDKVNKEHYAIANLVGGFAMVHRYHKAIDRALEEKIKEYVDTKKAKEARNENN